MKKPPKPEPNEQIFSSVKVRDKEKELLSYTLFKPPKYDTNYFHYTEIQSDWVAMSK